MIPNKEKHTLDSLTKELEIEEHKINLAIKAANAVLWEYDCNKDYFISYNEPLNHYDTSIPLSREEYLAAIHPDDVAQIEKTIKMLLRREDKEFNVNTRMKRPKTAEWQYCTITGSPSEKDDKGKIIKYIGLIKDNTEWANLKNKEEELNIQLRFALLAGNIIPLEWNCEQQSVHIPISEIKKNKKYLYQGHDEICTQEIIEHIHPDDRASIEQMFKDFESGKIVRKNIDFRFDINHEYKRYFNLLALSDIQRLGTKPKKVFGCLQDITERREAEFTQKKNKEFLQLILDNIPFPIQVEDVEENYKYVYWNKESQKVFGNGLHKFVHEILSKEDADKITAIDKEVYETGKKYSKQDTIKLITGKVFETFVNKSLISYGNKNYILTSRRDIQNLLDLEKKKKLLNLIMHSFHAYTWIFDINTNTIYHGEGFCDIGGHKEDYNTMNQFLEKVHPDDREKFNIINKIRKKKQDNFSIVYRIDLNNNGIYEWWECRGVTEILKDIQGNDIHSIYGLSINIDSLKINELKLSDALKKAEQSDKLKSAFLANMSHEIRTPLNAIVGFSEVLATTTDEEEKLAFCEIIANNNEILLNLINDILDLSKFESGIIEIKPKEFDLSRFFSELFITMQQRVKNPDVTLFCENPHKCCMVVLDRERITQVVSNFTINAIKYTRKGRITMGYKCIENGIELYVKDTGIGIPEDKKSSIFKRFGKLDDFAQGTGLGLSICKAIIDAKGGTIGFDSKEKVGSTFWARIPCEPKILKEVSKATSNYFVDNRFLSNRKSVRSTTHKKILVAEDINSNFILINVMLKNSFDIVRAENGLQAVKMLQKEHFDMVLMDIKMPIMDGLTATKKIRKFNRDIPIIAITAHAYGNQQEDIFKVGCNDYLAKPINYSSLFNIIEKYNL